jgi:speckle-type POZ protein
MFKHDTIENRDGVVKIQDIPHSTVEKLIEYIYTGSVRIPADIEDTMSLVEASDRYQLNELKNRCLRSLCTQITPDNVGKIAIVAYLHNAELVIQEEIRHYCQRYVFMIELKLYPL